MGYNADSSLYLAVPLDKVEAFRKELIAADMKVSKGATEADYESTPTAFLVVALINEDNGGDEEVIGNELIITGWGGGKCYPDDSTYDLIAKYATGTIDWTEDLDSDNRWRVRFKDGGWKNYFGETTTVYPGDPDDKGGRREMEDDDYAGTGCTPDERATCQRCKQLIPRLAEGVPQSDNGLTIHLDGGYGEFYDILPWQEIPHWHYCHECAHIIVREMGLDATKMHSCSH